MMLTHKQRDAYNFIASHIAETGRSPTYDQISEAMGFAGRSIAHRVVKAICERGYLRQTREGVDLGKRYSFFRVGYDFKCANGWPPMMPIYLSSRPARPDEGGPNVV